VSATGVDQDLVFLFTDIEGSTRLWEVERESMPAALARHNALLDDAITSGGGKIFKHVGDGVCAVFSDVRAALHAAISAQRALVATDWHAIGLTHPLTVRIALHAGTVQEHDGDFSGSPLNRLSRLLDAAHGSQILLFSSFAKRIATLPDGVELRDLGERRLRDLPGVEHILQVSAPGLPASFPPIRALDPAPHNLPYPPTACIDREAELAQLRTLFMQAGAHLVTLTGPGGIGKTRIALQVAFDLLDSFPDGVWFVDLSPVREDEQVAHSVMWALGIPERISGHPDAIVQAWLRERRLMLVLDNCEQIIKGAAALATGIGQHAPETTILATSRTPLGIRGERLISVGPLSLPSRSDQPELAAVGASPSVRLFVARAEEVRESFALTPDNVGAVAAICQQVEGIPLALELAAARVAILSPDALRQRLTHRLPLLTSGARDHPARHQTLRAAIDWSYELLSENERIVFRRLSVFAGGATLEAIEGFFDDSVGDPLLETLTALVSHNLLRVDQAAPDGPRFSMLETIREFAFDELELAQESETWRSAHANYFLDISAQAAPHLEGGPRQHEWMSRVDREYLNLRSAALWWLDRQEGQNVLELCTNIWRYWSVRGGAREGIELVRRALAAGDGVPPKLRAAALRMFGNLSIDVGDTRAARALYEESLAIEEATGNLPGIANSLIDLGMVASMQGRSEEFPQLLAEGARILRESGDIRGEATAFFNEAIGWREHGDLDRAEELHTRVLATQQALQDDIGIYWSWLSLGHIARYRGDLDTARSLSTRAFSRFRSVSDDQAAACAVEVLAAVELAEGNLDVARQHLQGALETHQLRNDMQKMAECLEGLALVEFQAGSREQASMALNRSVHLREQSGCPVPRIDAPALEQLAREIAAAPMET
jgi:predicted ATPase/class 3 adenylate cyclase